MAQAGPTVRVDQVVCLALEFSRHVLGEDGHVVRSAKVHLKHLDGRSSSMKPRKPCRRRMGDKGRGALEEAVLGSWALRLDGPR